MAHLEQLGCEEGCAGQHVAWAPHALAVGWHLQGHQERGRVAALAELAACTKGCWKAAESVTCKWDP